MPHLDSSIDGRRSAAVPSRSRSRGSPGGSGARGRTQESVEDFDGSYRLETGEIVTGGYMVEGDGYWIFMDTHGSRRGATRDILPGTTGG